MNASLSPSHASHGLSDSLLNRVLEKLEVSGGEPTPELLRAFYRSWSGRVPFDNVRKLTQVRAGDPGPLPGGEADDFLEAWLRHGTGGTCWAGAGALHAVVAAMGFHAERAIATMLVHPHLPPNHGTVVVTIEGEQFLLDTAMLYAEPLRLAKDVETAITHPARGVRITWRDGHCYVAWRPLHQPEGLECRIESIGASRDEYLERYEHTRGWSPFNYELYARTNRNDRVIGAAFGEAVTLHPDGTATVAPISREERVRMLIEDFGMSEEIASLLPDDVPTPPPPGSKTAVS